MMARICNRVGVCVRKAGTMPDLCFPVIAAAGKFDTMRYAVS